MAIDDLPNEPEQSPTQFLPWDELVQKAQNLANVVNERKRREAAQWWLAVLVVGVIVYGRAR